MSTFTAQYPGICNDCGEEIRPGQEACFRSIVPGGPQEVAHVTCPEEPKPGPICGGCFMEIPAGLSECPDCG